jgi:hypothetical protein
MSRGLVLIGICTFAWADFKRSVVDWSFPFGLEIKAVWTVSYFLWLIGVRYGKQPRIVKLFFVFRSWIGRAPINDLQWVIRARRIYWPRGSLNVNIRHPFRVDDYIEQRSLPSIVGYIPRGLLTDVFAYDLRSLIVIRRNLTIESSSGGNDPSTCR